MVPHCGSKTINVRLTVSPDSRTTKNTSNTSNASNKVTKKHRLKPRKLLKRDNGEEDSGSMCTADCATVKPKSLKAAINSGLSELNSNVYITEQMETNSNRTSKESSENRITCCTNGIENEHIDLLASNGISNRPTLTENIYESAPLVTGLKCKYDKFGFYSNNDDSCYREYNDCHLRRPHPLIDANDMIDNGKPSVKKLIRKSRSRKQKNNEKPHARIRSLSVGNEICYRNSRQRIVNSSDHRNDEKNGEGSSGTSGKDPNDECLNNLRRNDLIDIIRESMEKNRLCFQSNG